VHQQDPRRVFESYGYALAYLPMRLCVGLEMALRVEPSKLGAGAPRDGKRLSEVGTSSEEAVESRVEMWTCRVATWVMMAGGIAGWW
jgi:hypothetical protein